MRFIVVSAAAAAVLAAAMMEAGAFGRQAAAPSQPAAGVSLELARDRAARISDLHYTLAFSVPLDRQAPLAGRATIAFTLADPPGELALDFDPHRDKAIHDVQVNDAEAADGRAVNGHLLISGSRLRRGTNRVVVAFDAGDVPLNRSDDFLYTIFVPARAHEAFPCFDQPDLKARWSLSLEVPDGWEAVANGAPVSSERQGDRRRVTFAETVPISTYLFAFAAGKFAVERAERGGRELRMFHRESDAQKVARNRDAMFDLHASALAWMEEYTGIRYPFGKFDFVMIPAFQFGGMEHPGAVFYNARLLLDQSASQTQILDRANAISHETAHMWFGDLVTMRWFDDVWMKEVLANFMAAKIINPSFPAINHDLRFLLDNYPSAYAVDRTAGTNAIRQQLDNLSEAGTLYGAIIYQKAPIVMRQLELLVGADAFRDGLREYLRAHAFGNASWRDLVTVLDDRTPEDLVSWSHAWVEEAGRVIVTTELDVENDRVRRLAFAQRDPVPRRGLVWKQQMQVALGDETGVTLLPVRLNASSVDAAGVNGREAPKFVLPNGAGLAYGGFHLDTRSRRWLLRNLPSIADPLTRASAWVSLWDAMLEGEARPTEFADLALRALPREDDELIVQRILGYLSETFWRFMPDSERTSVAGAVESTLRTALDRASTQSLKGAYFATLRDVAQTGPTVAWLERIWRQRDTIPGLTLEENDYIALAQELAVRAVPGWSAILAEQIERTRNADRKARLQFVTPALSDDAAARDRFFESLKDPANRRREPWVLDAVGYLHHPLRATASEKYVRPSLDLLQEIQQTGDIFFPKRWMDATLSGHRSPAAARTVRAFLERLPRGYPDRLRRVILSSADNLFRAAR
jgi:aminopeptidase N